jgi:hypothetical protein
MDFEEDFKTLHELKDVNFYSLLIQYAINRGDLTDLRRLAQSSPLLAVLEPTVSHVKPYIKDSLVYQFYFLKNHTYVPCGSMDICGLRESGYVYNHKNTVIDCHVNQRLADFLLRSLAPSMVTLLEKRFFRIISPLVHTVTYNRYHLELHTIDCGQWTVATVFYLLLVVKETHQFYYIVMGTDHSTTCLGTRLDQTTLSGDEVLKSPKVDQLLAGYGATRKDLHICVDLVDIL